MQIPEIIYTDILINYTNIHGNCLISKYIEKERILKITKSINIINRCIYKWILEFRIAMNENNYYTPKIYYKKFYPLRDRKELIMTGLLMVNNYNYEYQKELYEEIFIKPNYLVINFNKFIDSLSYDDLMLIGW